jgi:cellulose synthase/poly-beta-1,6-N-acetylglucosamine synthase-like glycosyltransferase
MILEVLNLFFALSALFISVYLIRHYLFTLTVLRHAKTSRPPKVPDSSTYEPTVSILVPAHNEEKVVAKLLQNMAELVYPRSKLAIDIHNLSMLIHV